jgi:hypothetical protein
LTGGGEYQKLNSFFKEIGISHHVSCPHTHQQNGSAEIKHRYIVVVGLSLLFQASMPLKYWDEVFLTTTYLINRLPSRVIQGDTPYHRVFKENPNYNFLRAFGCACWPRLHPYNSHKLQFCSKQCVFMGYSTLHKRYKCFDLFTGQIYTSRDVVFDELIFPFSTLNPNAGPTLRAEAALHPTLFPDLSMGSQLTGDHVANFPLASDPVCSSYPMQQPQETHRRFGAKI